MDLEEQKEIWRREQLEVASQVEVVDDPVGEIHTTPRFRSIPLHPYTVNAENSAEPVYFGGVDVSFPTNEADPSVAVYVILEYPAKKLSTRAMKKGATQSYAAGYSGGREWYLPSSSGGAGIACFVGTRTGIPTIGAGKSLFYEGGLKEDLVLRGLEESLQVANDFFLNNKEDKKHESSDVVIYDRQSTPKEKIVAAGADITHQHTDIDRGILVYEMAIVCSGLAIPLTNDEGATLACALVGYGGKIGSKQHSKKGGTKNPIYISIGHSISLQESVQICAALSYCKIPEPIRQADLIGRDLLRIKEQCGG